MRQLKPAFRVSQVKFSGSSSGYSGSECRKSQVPGTQVWGPGSLSPSSRILGFRVPCLTVPESQVPDPRVSSLSASRSRVSGSQDPVSQGLRVPGPVSRVWSPDFRLWQDILNIITPGNVLFILDTFPKSLSIL